MAGVCVLRTAMPAGRAEAAGLDGGRPTTSSTATVRAAAAVSTSASASAAASSDGGGESDLESGTERGAVVASSFAAAASGIAILAVFLSV